MERTDQPHHALESFGFNAREHFDENADPGSLHDAHPDQDGQGELHHHDRGLEEQRTQEHDEELVEHHNSIQNADGLIAMIRDASIGDMHD
jgi:hypothetical protein